MYVCQWHIDVPFGKQKEALDIMSKWNKAMMDDQKASSLINGRTLVGHIGVSASHIINEAVVNSLTDWEAGLSVVNTGKFKGFSEEMAKYIVPGSQHWLVYRLTEETDGKK